MSYGNIIAVGAASIALLWLANEAGEKKKNWENNYQQYKNDLESFNEIVESKIKSANEYIDFEEYIQLHYQSFSVANEKKVLLDDARDSLKAIGQTIVMLKENKIEIEKNISKEKNITKLNDLKEELKSVKNTRKILFDDQDILKEQKDSLSKTLKKFNLNTRELKLIIKNNTGQRGLNWYNRLEARKNGNFESPYILRPKENIFISILNQFLK
jgi:hypothetical protein